MSEKGREQKSPEEILEDKILNCFTDNLVLVVPDATEEEKRTAEAKFERDNLIKEKVRQKLYFDVVDVSGALPKSAFDKIQEDLKYYKDPKNMAHRESTEHMVKEFEGMIAYMEKFRPTPESKSNPVANPAPENPIVDNLITSEEKEENDLGQKKLSSSIDKHFKFLQGVMTDKQKERFEKLKQEGKMGDADYVLYAVASEIVSKTGRFSSGTVYEDAEKILNGDKSNHNNPIVENSTATPPAPDDSQAKVEKADSKFEITPEIFNARKDTTVKFLMDLKEQREKINKIPEDTRNPDQIKRLASVEDIDSALVALSDPINNIDPGLKFISETVSDRAESLGPKSTFLNDDRLIVAMLNSTIKSALDEKSKGFSILSKQEILSFINFIEVAKKSETGPQTKKTIEELDLNLQELKDGKVLPAVEQNPAPTPDALPSNPAIAKTETAPVVVPATETPPTAETVEPENIILEDLDEARRKETLKNIEVKFGEKYEKFDIKTKDLLNKEINSEVEDAYRIFALKWIRNKQEGSADYFKNHGISFDGMDDEAKAKIVLSDAGLRKEALTDLDKNEDYKILREERNRGVDLMVDLGKDNVPIETRYLLVNFSQRLIEKKKIQLDWLKYENKGQDLIDAKNKEIEALFAAQKDVVEKINGKSLEQTAEEKLETSGIKKPLIKEEFIKSILDAGKNNFELAVQNYSKEELGEKYDEFIDNSKLSAEQKRELKKSGSIIVGGWLTGVRLSKKDVAMAESKGFNSAKIKRSGWFSQQIAVGDKIIADDLEDLSERAKEAWHKALVDDYTKSAIKTSEKKHDEISVIYENKKKEIIEKEIRDIASRSEKAEGGIGGVYEKVRERLCAEFLAGVIKKERSPEQIKKLDKIFSAKKRADFVEFIKDAIVGFNILNEGAEDFDSEMKILSGFFEEYGIKVDYKKLIKSVDAEAYKKAKTNKKAYVDFLLNFVGTQPWVEKKK